MERSSISGGFLVTNSIHHINCESHPYAPNIAQEACSGIDGWMLPLRVVVLAGVESVFVFVE